MDQRFEFISPVLVSPVQQNVDRATYVRKRADYIVRILRNAPKGKRFLMPYNSGQHWILAVIDPWDDSGMYFNPLGNEPGDDFKDLITTVGGKRNETATQLADRRSPVARDLLSSVGLLTNLPFSPLPNQPSHSILASTSRSPSGPSDLQISLNYDTSSPLDLSWLPIPFIKELTSEEYTGANFVVVSSKRLELKENLDGGEQLAREAISDDEI
ncbi:hypothetical protein TIFTF001_027959 [Ficus carica]|uniref:Ubiquitin-like protease family profile domain-containing protein n=1 Tax=Ficus carica TaxID=3494 RepID=A0AA88DNW7_FICCA|nr:hypothetical protein TIFTF001_027959 [Ficus carica]